MAGAIRELRGQDHRPLLLLREIPAGDKKLVGQMGRVLTNERIQLASGWFRCVRVEGDVASDRHPLHKAFTGGGRKVPASMVFSTADGTKMVSVRKPSPKDVWVRMSSVLRAAYAKNPTAAAKAWVRLLNTFDALDDKEKTLNEQLQKARASKRKSIEAKLAKLARDREKAMVKERELRALPLKPARKRATGDD